MEKVANTNAVKSQVPAQKNERSAEKDAEFKAKKAAAAKAFAERQKQKKEDAVKHAKAILEGVEEGTIKGISEDTIKFLQGVANPVKTGGFGGGQSFFNKVFGDDPKVGDKITLLDYMKKTLQAKGKIDKAIKDWAEKGIIVEYKAAANQLESTYEIKKLA